MRRPSVASCLLAGLVLSSLSTSGCAEIQFVRADGAAKYRPLASADRVQVAQSVQELPQPTAELGELSFKVTETKEAKADLNAATARLRSHAARYGCDALVAPSSETQETKVKRKAKKLDDQGRQVIAETEESIYTHHYRARCVRTAAAPGGLQDDPAPAAAPKLSAAATPPKPATTAAEPAEAGESDEDVVEVWRALNRYRRSFLVAWADKLSGPPASAMETLDAFNELMAQVTGPGGLWRKTMPREWYGCVDAPGTEQCKRLAKANEELEVWDAYQKKLLAQKGAAAKGWLKTNKPRILAYLDRYVPLTASLSAAQSTGFYVDKLR